MPSKKPLSASQKRAVERARKALAKAAAEREMGLTRPVMTGSGGPQAKVFRKSRRKGKI